MGTARKAPQEMSDSRDESITAIESTLNAEITAAYARKTSLETRATALITAALAAVTLYIALRSNIANATLLAAEGRAEWVTGALIIVGVSIMFAIVVALPLSYPMLGKAAFDEYIGEVERGEAHDHRLELLRARSKALGIMIQSNNIKVWALLGGFVALCVSFLILGVQIAQVSTV